MPRHKNKEGLQKHTLFLFEGDFEEIRNLHPRQSAAEVIRAIIRAYINGVRSKARDTENLRVEINL